MSQRASSKYRFTLQITAFIAVLAGFGGCASAPEVRSIHPSVGAQAKTLKYRATIDHVGLGSGDSFKKTIVGDDVHDLKRPVSVGLRDNIMYIFDGGEGYVFKYFLDTGRMTPLRGVGAQIAKDATDIYVAKDHSFYIADVEGRRVMHFDEDGDLLKIFFHGPNISRPVAVSVDEDSGDVYVADEVYSHVVVFDKNGEPLRGIGDRGTGPGKFRIITDMFKTDNAFYISDRIELSVQVLDLQGRYLTHFGEGKLIFPESLAVDKYGRVYVADKNESIIKVFKQGEVIDVIGKNGYGDGEFRNITDMKILNGYLYVVDSLNGRIQVFEILPDDSSSAPQDKTPSPEKTAMLH